MAKKNNPIAKADANQRPGQLTDQQKAEQVARFFTQRRESYFQGILYNMIRTGKNTNIKEMVDVALEGADYVLEKLFPIPTAEKKEDEK